MSYNVFLLVYFKEAGRNFRKELCEQENNRGWEIDVLLLLLCVCFVFVVACCCVLRSLNDVCYSLSKVMELETRKLHIFIYSN